jgi:hypothetical protein
VRANDGEVRVSWETTKEGLNWSEDRDESVNISITEHVGLNTIVLNIDLSVSIDVFELELVVTMSEDSFNMVKLRSTEEEPVLTEKTSGLLSIDIDGNIYSLIVLLGVFIAEGNFFEACSIELIDSRSARSEGSNIQGNEVSSWVLITRLSVSTGVDLVISHSFLVDIDLSCGSLDKFSLLNIVPLIIKRRNINGLNVTFRWVFNDLHGTEVTSVNLFSSETVKESTLRAD